MEILLVNHFGYKNIEKINSDDTILKVVVTHPEYESSIVRGRASLEKYRQQIVAASTEYKKKTGRTLCIHVKQNPTNPNKTCVVRVHGFLWENLAVKLEGVKVKLQLGFVASDPHKKCVQKSPAQFLTEIPILPFKTTRAASIDTPHEDCLDGESFAEASDVTFHGWWELFKPEFENTQAICARVAVSLVSHGEDYFTADSSSF